MRRCLQLRVQPLCASCFKLACGCSLKVASNGGKSKCATIWIDDICGNTSVSSFTESEKFVTTRFDLVSYAKLTID